jgi:hypothetical protein
VPLLDRAHLWFTGERSTVDGVVGGLLLRALGATRPGDVRVSIFDPERLGGSLPGFAPLVAAGLVTYVGPGGLSDLLDGLVEDIRRINESVLGGAHASVAGLAAAHGGRRTEPWRLAVFLADPATAEELTAAQRAQLDRIARTGVPCGQHLVVRGLPVPPGPTIERIRIGGGTARCAALADLPVRLDPPPRVERVAAFCRGLAERRLAGPAAVRFADLRPEKPWTESSAAALDAPIGADENGQPALLTLGDDPPHALVGGPSGSGKTNLLYAWLGGLCARYAPEELALYLLDFKEGVSFARFAPSPRDPSWLPHVRLVGLNVNNDREFGLALLRHLGAELRRRARAAKRYEAAKLAELRTEDPGGHWPRIVAVVDEFQVLLAGRDAVTAEAVTLLEDLARRGRSQGIHLVLASQDVSGIEALWGRSGLVGQFTLRIALPKARRILSETNLAAETVPRHCAVVNADSGVAGANRLVRLPDAGGRSDWRELQTDLWHRRSPDATPPRLFDGDAVPAYPESWRPPADEPTAVLGETIDVDGRPAVFPLRRAPGRNLAVLGTRTADACAVLAAAGRSLVGQGCRFSVVCLDDDALPYAAALHATLPDAGWYDRSTVDSLFATVHDGDTPHVVLGYAWDGRAGGGDLRGLLTRGPERRVHVLGWWRTVGRLRDDLGGAGARPDAIGGWVALDVHGADLAPLSPQPGGPTWYPRPHRALYFDRAGHRTPEVVIPYGIGS